MTAALLLLDSDALAFDFGPAAAGARQYVGSRDSVMAYVNAICAVPVGPQPFDAHGGGIQGTYDPLEGEPAMAAALRDTQNHAKQVVSYLDTLHGWSQGGVRQFTGEVLKPIKSMRETLASLPSGGVLSPDQDREVVGNMMLAKLWTEQIALAADMIRRGIQTFLTQIRSDRDTLVSGTTSIDAIRQKSQDRTSRSAMEYMFKPGMQGIANTILEIGAAQVQALEGLKRSIGNALQGHDAMRGGLDAFASGAESIHGKYAAAANALTTADAPTRSTALKKFDLNRAISSWEQFRDFILAAGF